MQPSYQKNVERLFLIQFQIQRLADPVHARIPSSLSFPRLSPWSRRLQLITSSPQLILEQVEASLSSERSNS